MKLYLSIILTLVVGLASAGECPRGRTTHTEPDGTRVIVRETGVITTLTPDNRVEHYFDPPTEAVRENTLRYCNLGAITSRIRSRTVIVTPSGTITGYITTK
jgi:hypothetical protein